jgi:hypothetical protein
VITNRKQENGFGKNAAKFVKSATELKIISLGGCRLALESRGAPVALSADSLQKHTTVSAVELTK